MKSRNLLLSLALGCAASALATAAFADPPSLVGRISALEGDISFLPPGETSWAEATRNFPVAEGESFWTGDDGRTELQIGPMEARLDSQTELDVLALDYGRSRFSLPQGSLELRLWRVPRGGVSIATPAGDIRIDREGLYRIDVGASPEDGGYPPVEVTVFDGAAGAPSPEGFVSVDAGSAALIYAGYDPQFQDAQDAAIDDWGRDRESHEHGDSQDKFATTLTGFEDLQEQGDFTETPDYGTVWFPRDVPADWAPYRYGHWSYVQPWGWTWIDDQSWGFAPFHYGRWARINDRWGWIPGRPSAEPVYAPALVAFVGGHGWNISLGVGESAEAVGWVPLAPDEIYRPSYQVSQTYVRQVNITNVRETTINNITVNNVTNVANVTQYRNAPAATVVRSDAFAGGASVQRVPVSAAVLMRAPAATISDVPAPTRQARMATPMGETGVAPRAGGGSGPMRAAPPPARLQTIREAVAAQAPGSNTPAPIAGVRVARPAPKPVGVAAPFIAPAQTRIPTAQGRVTMPRPGPTPHATRQAPAAFPLPNVSEGVVAAPMRSAPPTRPFVPIPSHPEANPPSRGVPEPFAARPNPEPTFPAHVMAPQADQAAARFEAQQRAADARAQAAQKAQAAQQMQREVDRQAAVRANAQRQAQTQSADHVEPKASDKAKADAEASRRGQVPADAEPRPPQ